MLKFWGVVKPAEAGKSIKGKDDCSVRVFSSVVHYYTMYTHVVLRFSRVKENAHSRDKVYFIIFYTLVSTFRTPVCSIVLKLKRLPVSNLQHTHSHDYSRQAGMQQSVIYKFQIWYNRKWSQSYKHIYIRWIEMCLLKCYPWLSRDVLMSFQAFVYSKTDILF